MSKLVVILLFLVSLTFDVYGELKPREKLLDMSNAFCRSKALHVVARMGVAEMLKDGPKSVDVLSRELGVNSDVLRRILAVLVNHGVFEYNEECDSFGLNEVSALLVSDNPNSLVRYLGKESYEPRWHAVSELMHVLKTGESSFEKYYGSSYYDYLKKDVDGQALFDAGMSEFSEYEDKSVVKSYDFSGHKKLVDVGGGRGSLLALALLNTRDVTGVLFEVPEVLGDATYLKYNRDLKGRYSLEGGSFFERVPEGGDLYFLKRIVNNWSQDECVVILRNVAKAMAPGGKILIIEKLKEDGSRIMKNYDHDILMLALIPKAQSYTRSELDALVQRGGFCISQVIKTDSGVSIVECSMLNKFISKLSG